MFIHRRTDTDNAYDSVVLVSLPEEAEERPIYMAISHRKVSERDEKIYAYVCIDPADPNGEKSPLKSSKNNLAKHRASSLQKNSNKENHSENNHVAIPFSPFPPSTQE